MFKCGASVCPSGLDRTPVAAMSDDEDWCSAPTLVDSDDENLVSESDDEDSDESVSPPWRLQAACEWASFAHRLLLRQELREKHYMMRRMQNRSKFTWLRQELRGQDLRVTQFCPGHGKEHIDQTFSMTAIFVDTVMGRRPITRSHYGRLLWALATGRHPLSKTDRVKLYLNGRNSNFPY